MKWMLVAVLLVLDTVVPTELLYDDLAECLAAINEAENAFVREGVKRATIPGEVFALTDLRPALTCIPHAGE